MSCCTAEYPTAPEHFAWRLRPWSGGAGFSAIGPWTRYRSDCAHRRPVSVGEDGIARFETERALSPSRRAWLPLTAAVTLPDYHVNRFGSHVGFLSWPVDRAVPSDQLRCSTRPPMPLSIESGECPRTPEVSHVSADLVLQTVM
jgi:hypothetical protein